MQNVGRPRFVCPLSRSGIQRYMEHNALTGEVVVSLLRRHHQGDSNGLERPICNHISSHYAEPAHKMHHFPFPPMCCTEASEEPESTKRKSIKHNSNILCCD